MNEPPHTEAVKTDLPSPKPNRRKRLALRFAVLVVAVSALGAAYWFTRPPELVWWTSPQLDEGIHFKILIPSDMKEDSGNNDGVYWFHGADRRPRFLQWLVRPTEEVAALFIEPNPNKRDWPPVGQTKVERPFHLGELWSARRQMIF